MIVYEVRMMQSRISGQEGQLETRETRIMLLFKQSLFAVVAHGWRLLVYPQGRL